MIGTCGKKILLSSKQVLFVTEVFSMESALSALVDEVAGVKLGDKRLTKRLAIRSTWCTTESLHSCGHARAQ